MIQMNDYSSAEKNVIIKIASSTTSIDQLINKIGKVNDKKNVVQLFDPKKVVNKTHLLGAYVNTLASFRDKSNISNNMAIEMLLFVAMTRQISDAIIKVGAKSDKRFIIFANSKGAYLKLKKFLKDEMVFDPSIANQAKIARELGINQQKEINQFLLQKIAMSRLTN